MQKKAGGRGGEARSVAGKKQESGASPPLGLSSLETAHDHHLCFSHRVCRLWLQKNNGNPVPDGLHSGASGASRDSLCHSTLALAPAGGLPAHLLLLAVLLVMHPCQRQGDIPASCCVC